ncbi:MULTISPECIES: hypothetical protein [Bradyrhizobium]|jgi:hypothetical protein|uniref:Uncharacterized protein n=2 Tax=Bradyrhizobium TaxID=374 RepID=A0A809X4B9_9BRAD|nr:MULTISPECIES: hypothetical protein [Bradyrhizobium]BCE22156.1 hypothetical protein XF1B_48370 [Bradyrhizobium diazoefficiens]MBP1297084.1 hypothetical protein [Bradyrhizobium elkanii]MCP1932153.1 hypothetical protein [Bradyrhizobium elkanii]MCS3449889.1 hypothetical protein [Bradyrhizobium elkanii]MCS3558967.1 hypothetical protein [Bradyrhizobium elkanii]
MSRRRQLQIIRDQIHAEMRDGLTQTMLIAFLVIAAIDVIARNIH